VELAGGIGEASEINDGVEEISEDHEVASEGIGFFSGDDIELERGVFGVGEKIDREEARRQRGGSGKDGMGKGRRRHAFLGH
jgi:hypothetical protein